jgi:hypothetical protein
MLLEHICSKSIILFLLFTIFLFRTLWLIRYCVFQISHIHQWSDNFCYYIRVIFITDMSQYLPRRPLYRTVLYNIFLLPSQQMIWHSFSSTINFTIIPTIFPPNSDNKFLQSFIVLELESFFRVPYFLIFAG